MKQTNLRDSSLADSLEIVLEPRVMFDGAAVATVAQAADQVNHQADNTDGDNHEVAPQADSDIPSISATGTNGKLSVDKEGNATGSVDVFENVSVSGDKFDHITLEVDADGEGHVLHIGGVDIPLKAGNPISMSGEYQDGTCQVSLTGEGKYSITVDVLTLTADQVKNLINSLEYKTTDGKLISNGQTIDVKITGISSSDTENGDLENTIESKITVESEYNQDPSISIGGGNFNITDQENFPSQDAEISSDGSKAWLLGNDGTIKVFNVTDGKLVESASLSGESLAGAKDITISKDGTVAYVLLQGNVIQELHLSDGTIEKGKSFTAIVNANIQDVSSFAVSDDGKFLYTTGSSGYLFVWDLTKDVPNKVDQQQPASMHGSIQVLGDKVFVASGGMFAKGEIKVYQQQSNGSLTELTDNNVEIPTNGIYDSTPLKTAMSADGKHFAVYTEGWDGNVLFTYSISDDGKLILGSTIKPSGVINFQFSADGSSLNIFYTNESGVGQVDSYAVSSDGLLGEHKTVADNLAVSGGIIQAEGTLISWGNSVVLLGQGLVGTLGQNVSFGSIVDFSDPELDLKDNFVNSQVGVEIQGAQGDFVFSADGYTAIDGKIYFGGKVVAEFTKTETSLNISFLDGCTKEQALKAVQGWSFAAATSDAGKANITVTFTDDAGKSSSADIDASFGVNLPPSASLDGNQDISLNSANKGITIFDGVTLSTGEAGQKFTQVQISVSGLDNVDATETITVDGSEISLSQAGAGETSSGISWSYTINEGKGTLVLKSVNGVSLENTQNILNSISYKTGAIAGKTTQGLTGERIFAVTSLTDNGGTAQGGKDTSTIDDVSVKLTLALNSAPILNTSGSDHNPSVYVPGNIDEQIKNLLPSFTPDWDDSGDTVYSDITAISSSTDGKFLFVAANDNDDGAGKGTFFIFSRDAETGKLALVSSFSAGSLPGFESSVSQNISSIFIQGSHVYLGVTANDGSESKTAIVLYDVNADGTIEQKGIVVASGENDVSGLKDVVVEMKFSTDGRYLYCLEENGINKFQVNSDGTLQYPGSYAETSLSGASSISLAGSYIYITNSDKSISILKAEDLSLVSSITKDSIGSAMPSDLPLKNLYGSEVSADGKFLYVVGGSEANDTNPSLAYVSSFAIDDDGNLSFIKTTNLADDGFHTGYLGCQMQMSADGKNLIISSSHNNAGGSSDRFAFIALDGKGGVSLSTIVKGDGNLDLFTVLPDGSIYCGDPRWADGLSLFVPAPSVDTVGGEVHPGLGMDISDVDADAKGSYDGFNLTIERDGGADSSDHFSLRSADISVDTDGKVSYKGIVIGTLTLDNGTASVSFSGDVSKEAVNAVLNAITYQVPDKATDVIKLKITVNDGVKLNNDEDSSYFEDSTVVAVIPQSVAIEPDHQTLPYDNQGTNAFANVGIQFTADAEKLIGGSSLTVTPTDTTATFGVSGDYTLADDGTITDKQGKTIATLKTGANGSVTLTFDQSVTKDQINGLVKAMTYQTGNSDPQGKVTFGLELKSSEGKTLDSCSVASTIDFGENHPPVVDQTIAGNWKPEVTPGKDVALDIPDGLITDVDEKDQSLTWSVDGAPQGWTIEMVNDKPVIKGSVSADFTGATITLKATDKAGASASVEIYISAEGVENTPPVWNNDAPSALANSYSAGTNFDKANSIDFSQYCTDNEGQKITYSMGESNLPSGELTISQDGKLSGILSTPGSYKFTVIATDASGQSSSITFNLQVTNEPPVFGGKDTSWTVSANKGTAFEHDFSKEFTDKEESVDGTQNLTLTLEFTDPKLDTESYDFQNDKLTLIGVQPGTYHFTITADDGFGGTLAQEFTVEVTNSQPEFTGKADLVTGKADLGSVTTDDTNIALDVKGQFTDADKNQTLTFEVSEADQANLKELGLTFDAETGTVKALDGSPTKAGTVDFTVSVKDGFSDPVTQIFTVEVRENQQPTLDPGWVPGENATAQGNTVNVTIKTPFTADISDAFKDPDAADAGKVTIEVKDADSLPSWLHYDAATKTFSGTPETLGAVSVTVVVSDGHGDPIEHTLVFNVDNPSFTVPVSQFRHAPLYDPAAAHEFEEDLLMPVAPTSDLPDASIDLAGSSAPFATSQGLSMAMAALQSSEPGSKGLSGAALLSAAQVAHSVQHGDVAQPLHGMDQTGKATAVRAGSSMTLPTQGDKGTPVDEFLWQGSNVILNGTPTADGDPVVPSKVVPAQVSMAGKPALTQQVHESSAYGDEQPSAKA